MYFNPIIVLFLTREAERIIQSHALFQSYYSLISNMGIKQFLYSNKNFNPIIVLFLTLAIVIMFFFNSISILL